MHACTHRAVTNNRNIDDAIGDFISIFTLTGWFDRYKRGHVTTHHSENLLFPGDELYDFLIGQLRLPLGKPKEDIWKHYILTLVSPVYHGRAFAGRLQRSFFSDVPRHNIGCWLFWGTVVAVTGITGTWGAFLLAWLLPLSVFFEISSCLRQGVEHHWPLQGAVFATRRERLNHITSAIFFGERTPDYGQDTPRLKRMLAWGRWSCRMLFYHLPARMLVLTGDAPCHDYHHHAPGSLEWRNAIFAREAALSENQNVHYTHTWGLLEAIDKTFASMSLQKTPEHE